MFASGSFLDAVEVTVTWDRVERVVDTVMNGLSRQVLCSATLSNPYPHGCSITFTLAGSAPTDEAMLEKYDATWKNAMKAVLDSGGVLSYRHGIGMLKANALRDEMGNAFQVLAALKNVFDPDHLLNPGKLI